MRILHLIQRPQMRGAETFAKQLAAIQQASGHQVAIASLFETKGQATLDLNDFKHFCLHANPRNRWLDVPAFRRLATYIKNNHVDIVQANAADSLKYAVLSRKLFGWKAPVVYRNASIASAWMRSPLHRRLNTWLLRQPDAIACVSRKSLADLRDNLFVPEQKLCLMGNGRVTKSYSKELSRQQLHQETNAPLSDIWVFHIGAFTWEKNQQGLLRIFKRVMDAEALQKTRLVLIGDGPLKSETQALAREYGLADICHFLGYRNDVQSLLPGADLLVLPSLIEGLPGVVLEAGAYGVPVVAYKVGATDECIPDDIAGRLLIEKGDEEAFASAVLKMLNDRAFRTDSGEKMQAYVKEHYDIRQVAMRFSVLYERILGPSNA